MKTWTNAEIEVLDVKSTAYGPQNPNEPDEAKYAVKDENGNILGWEATYGEPNKSQGNN